MIRRNYVPHKSPFLNPLEFTSFLKNKVKVKMHKTA